MKEKGKQKVFVGMSGGVDSSVSAALLKEEGYDVVGVFIKVWQADFLPCTWREERREAMRAAAHLNIPFYTLDLEKEYKQEVVDYMIAEYGKGRVPNPDVMCNKYVKFGAFLSFAEKHGADFIATGHYARVKKEDGVMCLLSGKDEEKDQSYFLWTLRQEELAHVLFPVGHLQKSAVRRLAHKYKLQNAEKKDSQGLCFMGAVDMESFLKHYLKTEPGKVLDISGDVIGTHEGAILYTIGQRRGFLTNKTSSNENPYFVIQKDLTQNTITVAHHDPNSSHGKTSLISVSGVNLISPLPNDSKSLEARIRYHGKLLKARVTEGSGAQIKTLSLSPKESGVSAGQSIVFYQGEYCLGGAVIESTE